MSHANDLTLVSDEKIAKVQKIKYRQRLCPWQRGFIGICLGVSLTCHLGNTHMKIHFIVMASALVVSAFVTTQPLATPRVNPELISMGSAADNFSVYGILTSYWLKDKRGEIPIMVTTQEHLLITAHIYDQYDNEKAQTATLINNRSKGMTLPLENFSAGDYRLVITSLDTNHRHTDKTYYMTLTNTTGED